MKKAENIPGSSPKIPKESPFSVPDGYFESFSERLHQRIKAREEKPIQRVKRLKPQLAWMVSLAAVFIIGFTVFRFLLPHQSPQPKLSKADISAYLQQQSYSQDESMVLDDEYSAITASEDSAKTSVATEREEYKEEIIKYLIRNGIDTYQITAKL